MRCWTSDGNPLAYWPFRIRAVQGHTRRAISTAAASDTFNATLIYANSGAAALAKVAATGKTIVTPEDTPCVVYHRTTRGNWKGILDIGFIPGVGNEYLPAELIAILARLVSKKAITCPELSGLRAERPVETRVAMQEAVRSGVVFIKTASEGILTTDVVPAQFVVSVDDTEKKVNLYRRHRETVQSAVASGAQAGVQEQVEAHEAESSGRS